MNVFPEIMGAFMVVYHTFTPNINYNMKLKLKYVPLLLFPFSLY